MGFGEPAREHSTKDTSEYYTNTDNLTLCHIVMAHRYICFYIHICKYIRVYVFVTVYQLIKIYTYVLDVTALNKAPYTATNFYVSTF